MPRPQPERHCPDCRKPVSDDQRLCPLCGATPLPRGYCPVCRRRWNLPPGTPCPKHDPVALQRQPDAPALDRLRIDPRTPWITLRAYPDELRARLAANLLDEHDIPAILHDAHMGAGEYRHAVGGVKLKIPRHLAETARAVLDAPNRIPDDDEPETPIQPQPESETPDTAPNPELELELELRAPSALLLAILLLVAAATLILLLPAP